MTTYDLFDNYEISIEKVAKGGLAIEIFTTVYTEYNHFKQTMIRKIVYPPTWFERIRGITFKDKLSHTTSEMVKTVYKLSTERNDLIDSFGSIVKNVKKGIGVE